jgi:DNA polymerase III epsilon subunit family exonuclease
MFDKLKDSEYIVLDLETTWLIPYREWITEIAAIKCKNWKILDEFQTLINPERHIPNWIVRLTWITNEMVADAPTIKEVMPIFSEFLGNAIIVWHNVSFDFRFLSYYHYQCMWNYLENETLCTLKIARKLLPELPNKKLWTICEYFGITNESAHRAMWDTRATLKVLERYQMMDNISQINWNL